MNTVKHNITLVEARAATENTRAKHGNACCYFAGVVYDPDEEVCYRIAAPVDVYFDLDDDTVFEIPLPSISEDEYWKVALPPDEADLDTAILLVEGPITENNVWEIVPSYSEPTIGPSAEVDADAQWPKWSEERRRLIAQGQLLSPDGVLLDDSPELECVLEVWAAYEAAHGDADIYYKGSLISLDADEPPFTFPGMVFVADIDQGFFTIPLLDGLYEWPVEPVPPYSFEIVPSDCEPSEAIYDVPAHELWPDFALFVEQYAAAEAAEGLEATLTAFGFVHHWDVTGRISLADLLPARGRSGIYVLHMADEILYVGQSVDVVKRYSQHRHNYEAIVAVSFKPVRAERAALDLHEETAIKLLESKGFPLLNILHASVTAKSSEFDLLIPVTLQKAWLLNGMPLCSNTLPSRSAEDIAAQRRKTEDKWKRFQQRPDRERLLDCLQIYVQHCIPAPRITEQAYWSLSCLPSTNASTWPRLVCFNANVMEIFVVGHFKEDPKEIWAFLNVSTKELEAAYPDDRAFLARHPNATIRTSGYQAPGIDQVNVRVETLKDLKRLLDDRAIQRAACVFNLHLMRKRRNQYGHFHCVALADVLMKH
jgi:hypothetical protein